MIEETMFPFSIIYCMKPSKTPQNKKKTAKQKVVEETVYDEILEDDGSEDDFIVFDKKREKSNE